MGSVPSLTRRVSNSAKVALSNEDSKIRIVSVIEGLAWFASSSAARIAVRNGKA